MKKQVKKRPHGGRRQGAGRKPKHPEGKGVYVGVQVPEGLLGELDRQAEAAGKTRSEVLVEFIRGGLDRQQKTPAGVALAGGDR